MLRGFGKELIFDLFDCDTSTFARRYIKDYFVQLCKLIKMEREKLCWWDYKGLPDEYRKAPPHLKGTTAVQFIKTSNITIHTLDARRQVYLNVFSCKNFDKVQVLHFTEKFFKGTINKYKVINR